jgi:hypothetical protein
VDAHRHFIDLSQIPTLDKCGYCHWRSHVGCGE